MKNKSITAIAFLVMATTISSAFAVEDSSMEQNVVPEWIKNNAGWWADGAISDGEFISAIEFLIQDRIIIISSLHSDDTGTSGNDDGSIPEWIKNNAGWWADGAISDAEFLNGLEYLIQSGIISVPSSAESHTDAEGGDTSTEQSVDDPTLQALEVELEACSEITIAYQRSDCEKLVEHKILVHTYKTHGQQFVLGPIVYYWFGVGSEGNEFEITPTGQPILSIRMLAENTSPEITSLNCTSPSICSYDVWDGTKAFKYSGMDFTSGAIALNPGVAKEFNILFGPNVGYGGTEFEYDPDKSYYFRINEPFGSTSILLDLE